MRRPRLAPIALLVTAALLAAGCGGDDDDAAVGPPTDGNGERVGSPFDRDPCELLGEADLEQTIGEASRGESTPGEEDSLTPGQCQWAGSPSITLFLGDEQIFDNTRILAERGEDFEELEGVGDAAYVGAGEGGVLIDEAGITITPLGVDVNDPQTHQLIADLLERAAANH